MPRIFGLMIAKNEVDIIGQCLRHALDHCDKIIVMDNMSTDGTWELVEALAAEFPNRIVPHCRIDMKFHDNLRAIGYNAFRHELSTTDWWLRLDADEFMNAHPAATLLARPAAGTLRRVHLGRVEPQTQIELTVALSGS